MMNTISIHVPNEMAKMYEHANKQKKREAEQYISAWLAYFLKSDSSNDILFEMMKQTSETARKNGLTPEILEDLLKDEE